MRIGSVAHRLVREIIADCLGPIFKTHVLSFMNKGHLSKMLLNYQRSRFTWKNYGSARSLYGCSL